jgi:hypothetical protein
MRWALVGQHRAVGAGRSALWRERSTAPLSQLDVMARCLGRGLSSGEYLSMAEGMSDGLSIYTDA